jgi:hypothetical protein
MLSLDAQDVLSDDEGGRTVPLGERIPDRSVDVLTIVILRELIAEALLQLRQARADRGEEYTNRSLARQESAMPPRSLHLIKPGANVISMEEVEQPRSLRKAA